MIGTPRFEGDQEVTILESNLTDAAKGNGNVPLLAFDGRGPQDSDLALLTASSHVTLRKVHTRRIAAFFLGAWLAGCLLMMFLSVQDSHSAAAVISTSLPQARKIIDSLGADQAALLLRHAAAEETRSLFFTWEWIEILLALILGGCLFLATQKRVLPIVLCGGMLALVLFQHFGLASELAYRGRETDFPPGNALVGPIERLRALQAVYYGVELTKLIAGGILASYLFVFRSSRRSSRKEINAVDNPDHRHVNR
jgi:hypothetical protein